MNTKRTGYAWVALLLVGACSASSGGAGPEAGSSGSGSGAASSGMGSSGSGSTSGGTGSGSGGTGADGSAPAGIQGLFLAGFDIYGAHSSVVYDAKGGLHVVGYASSGLRYGECSSNCGESGNWAYASIPMTSQQNVGTDKTFLVLAVDGQGHPRVMAAGTLPNYVHYTEYAECNAAACASASSWTARDMTPMASGGRPASTAGLPAGDQFFAVSPQGEAAFAYFDSGRGIVYSSCTSDCASTGTWQEAVVMASPSINVTSASTALAFDAAGNPRLAFDFLGGTKTWYAACGGNCTSSSGWTATSFGSQPLLLPSGRLLALDPQGRATLLGTSQYDWCDENCATDSSSWQGPGAIPDMPSWVVVDAQNDLRAAAKGHYLACTAGCNSASPVWQDTSLPYSYLDGNDPTEQPGDQWGSFDGYRTTVSLDVAGNAAVTLEAQRWYMYNQVAGGTAPDDYGVFLWLIPAVADSGGSSGSGSTSGSGSGSSGSGSADGGSSGLSNFEGAAWSGTLMQTVSCGDAGTRTSMPSESLTFTPTASGFSYTDNTGCTFDFTVSGSTATLSDAPVTCNVSTDAGVIEIQYTSVTLATADGHNLTVNFRANEPSLSCSVVASGTLTR